MGAARLDRISTAAAGFCTAPSPARRSPQTYLYIGSMAKSPGRMDNAHHDQMFLGREVALLDSAKVAVVDDDAFLREALKSLLRSAGYRVATFGSAEELLRSGQSPNFACLVLDVRMSGMSGVELQDRLLASGSKVPIVFMTAHADASVRARALAAGAVRFLQKPFSDDALLDALDASIRRARP